MKMAIFRELIIAYHLDVKIGNDELINLINYKELKINSIFLLKIFFFCD